MITECVVAYTRFDAESMKESMRTPGLFKKIKNKKSRHTCIVVGHARNVLSDGIHTMFAYHLQFVILRQRSALCDDNSDDMEATVICCACKAMNAL